MLALLVALAACGPEPTPTPSPGRTPTLSLRLEPLRPNPLAALRVADLAAPIRSAVDGVYCTPAWRSSNFPATLALPIQAVDGDLLLEWNSSGTSNYLSGPDATTYGLPAAYTIATSADSTDGRNGSWRQVASVTGNMARTRAHRFPAAGARWVRMTVMSAVPGPLGKEFSIDEITLHDAPDGADDTVFFLGDSITVAAFTRCPANQPSFAELVHRGAPQHFPAMIDGGIDGVNSSYGVSAIEDLLDLNPDFHIWAVGYGTNDAWQKIPPSVFESQMQTIVDRIVKAGRMPVIARIPFAVGGPDDEDVRALNQVIDRLTARNRLLPGPDLYAWFSEHRGELSPDGVHPSDAGTRSINRLWYEALRPLYDSSPEQ